MPYTIQTEDGIEIFDIPDNIAPDADILKKRVADIRKGNLQGQPAQVQPSNGVTPTPVATDQQIQSQQDLEALEQVKATYPNLNEDQYKKLASEFRGYGGSEFEKGYDKFTRAVSTVGRFIGLEQGEPVTAQEYEAENKMREQGMGDAEIKSRNLAKRVKNTGINMLMNKTPFSFVRGVAAMTGLSALKDSTDAILDGDSAKDVVGEGLTGGGTGGLVEAGMQGAFRGIPVAGKAITGAIAKKGEQLLAKSGRLKDLKSGIEDLGTKTKDAALQLKDKIEGLYSDKLQLDKLKSGMKRAKNEISAPNLEPSIAEANKISRHIDDYVISTVSKLNSSVGTLKTALGKEYNQILKSEVGSSPVDIENEISQLGEALNIKSSSPKQLLSKIYDSLSSVTKTDKRVGDDLKKIGEKSNYDQGLILRDAHWVKQALNDYGSRLIKSPSTQELGINLFGIARSIDDKIDQSPLVDGAYKTLNSKYRSFAQNRDFLDSSLGREFRVDGNIIRKMDTNKIQNLIRKEIESGRDISSQYVQQLSAPVRAIYTQIKLLNDNGFIEAANVIKKNMDEVTDLTARKLNIKKQQQALKAEYVRSKKEFSPEEKQIFADAEFLESEIKDLKLSKSRMETAAASEKNKLTREHNVLADELGETKLMEDMQAIEDMTLANSFGQMAGKYSNAIGFALKLRGLSKVLKKKGAIGAKHFYEINERIDKFIINHAAPFKSVLSRELTDNITQEVETYDN